MKSQFGYHIVQVEERQPAHTQPLSEVLPTIQATLVRQNAATAQDNYARTLTSEAIKNGLEKTAAAHHLELVTTPPVGSAGRNRGAARQLAAASKAFASKQGDPPQYAPTGEGYAIFQVTGIVPAHAPAFADWKIACARRLPRRAAAGPAEPEDQGTGREGEGGERSGQGRQGEGATVKTSDLVGETGQVPDLGAGGPGGAAALRMTPGAISGPIDAQRTGVVAKLIDKQEPTADEIAKELRPDSRPDSGSAAQRGVRRLHGGCHRTTTRSTTWSGINAKAQNPQMPGDVIRTRVLKA